MGVSILSDDHGAVLYCNTEMTAFGPVMTHPFERTESGHRDIARQLLDALDASPQRMSNDELAAQYHTIKRDILKNDPYATA